MRILSKIALVFLPFLFANANIFAANSLESDCVLSLFPKSVDEEETRVLSNLFFERMDDYLPTLMDAAKASDISKMDEFVEKGDTWYGMFEFIKEHGGFNLPHAVGQIPIYSAEFLTFLIAKDEFKKQKDSMKITQESEDVYAFKVDKIKITVRYKDGIMKFMKMESREIQDLYGSKEIRKFF